MDTLYVFGNLLQEQLRTKTSLCDEYTISTQCSIHAFNKALEKVSKWMGDKQGDTSAVQLAFILSSIFGRDNRTAIQAAVDQAGLSLKGFKWLPKPLVSKWQSISTTVPRILEQKDLIKSILEAYIQHGKSNTLHKSCKQVHIFISIKSY